MSKYSELAEMLDGAANGSPDGADAELFNEAAAALRELEAMNAEHQSLHGLMQMRIEKLEAGRDRMREALEGLYGRVRYDVDAKNWWPEEQAEARAALEGE